MFWIYSGVGRLPRTTAHRKVGDHQSIKNNVCMCCCLLFLNYYIIIGFVVHKINGTWDTRDAVVFLFLTCSKYSTKSEGRNDEKDKKKYVLVATTSEACVQHE